ncbi:MAG: AtpZ/AtpI family protein [Candidatus Zixiibacteriota bacterium]
MLLGHDSKSKPDRDLRQVSLLATVPAILFAAPAIGFFAGRWADEKFGSEPYLLIVGVIFGFVAAGIETYRLVKKSSAMDKNKDEEWT